MRLTHLEALDDVRSDGAGRFGEVLGGGCGPRPDERDDLTATWRPADVHRPGVAFRSFWCWCLGMTPDR